ncbi:hypothetical protein [Actinoplanes sp. CA-252034]|uniref:hypothetical protein n=1 Tax=Actinoplanes sp. CA-252034 TaxID=3239906 RepID=UPI003D96D68B
MRFDTIVEVLRRDDVPIYRRTFRPEAEERAKARHFISFLEGRRVLYQNPDRDITGDVVKSILEIRTYLTEVIGDQITPDALAGPARCIRKACLGLLDAAPTDAYRQGLLAVDGTQRLDPRTAFAVRRLRLEAAESMALVAAAFGLDIEDQFDELIVEACAR